MSNIELTKNYSKGYVDGKLDAISNIFKTLSGDAKIQFFREVAVECERLLKEQPDHE